MQLSKIETFKHSYEKVLPHSKKDHVVIRMMVKTPALHVVSSPIQCKRILARARKLAGSNKSCYSF